MISKEEYRYLVGSNQFPYIVKTNDFQLAKHSVNCLNDKYNGELFYVEDTYTGSRWYKEDIKNIPPECEQSKTPNESEGKKYDGNKPMTGTILRVFPYALNAVGACIKFGATKYPDPNNWKKNKNALVRYNDSLIRHLTKHFTGNELDEETKLPHLAHVAWNALAILELYLIENPEKAKELMYPQEIRE